MNFAAVPPAEDVPDSNGDLIVLYVLVPVTAILVAVLGTVLYFGRNNRKKQQRYGSDFLLTVIYYGSVINMWLLKLL